VLTRPGAASLEVRGCTVNGEAAIGLYERRPDDSTVIDSVCVLVLDAGVVTTVLLVRNPDKLVGLRS
jgi:hypothetical protein